jgi:hypothetical protein
MGDAGQVPLDLQLAVSVPLGIRAYRRRFQSPVTNLQTAGPDDYINIYPDTSTPGSFIDPESTYLSFDFQVLNNEFCVDYTDFGVEGVGGAIIQDWRVYNQGSILEEILEYGTVASTLSNIEGAYESETTMYFSSKLKTGFQEECHRNFIKPPMVTGSGQIMFGLNPFGVGISTTCPNLYSNTGSSTIAAGQIMHNDSAINMLQNTDAVVLTGFAQNATNTQIYSYQNPVNTSVLPSWTTPLSVAAVNASAFPDLFDPSMVTPITEYIREFGTINKPQIMANLCNVKCFPIGMIPASNCWSLGQNSSTVPFPYGNSNAINQALSAAAGGTTPMATSTPPLASNSTYRICYRPYSGIFGKMATKMLATTLLAPQQLYINIHLATAAVALQLSADPCRRIAGTIRDFVRNLGTLNGQAYGTGTYTVTNSLSNVYNTLTSTYAPGYSPYHSVPIVRADTQIGGSMLSIFNAASCAGRGNMCSSAPANKALRSVGGATEVVVPTPQYALSPTPWLFNGRTTAGTTISYAAETEVFYGTYLMASVPQSSRIFALSSTGSSLSNPAPNVTYKISNMNLIGDQLILPNETTADIIIAAEAGNFNVHTNSVRTYNLQIAQSSTQSIICPLKVNMAKRILFVFQNQVARNAQTGFLYDSNCGLNPFASIASSSTVRAANANGFKSTGAAPGLTGVGFAEKLVYSPTTTSGVSSSISLQLRIGNDFYPPQPLTTMQEIAVELCKTLEGWQNSSFSPEVDGPVQMISSASSPLGSTLTYDCLKPSKFTTAFVHNDLLDDQTITGNYDFVPLHSFSDGVALSSAGSMNAAATATSRANGYNGICPRGYCVQGMFKSPSSRFVLGFNMRSFKSSDGVDGGTYLGNNTITLIMSGCTGLSVSGQSYRGLAIVPHRVAMRYSPGGQIVWAY